jgi:hypothetical protein
VAKKAKPELEPPAWETMRTAETRRIEERLRAAGFAQVDAYRFNSASIRIRIIDPRFEDKPGSERQDLVFPVIDKLPKRTREDILLLLTLAPSEVGKVNRRTLINLEFEHPLTIGR